MKKFNAFIFLILISLLFVLPCSSYADDVTIVKSVDILPYQETVKGFKSVVTATISEHVVAGNDGGNSAVIHILKDRKTELIFALGTDALRLARNRAQNDIPIIFAFVLNPETVMGSDVEGWSNVVGVDMTIPPEEQFNTLLRLAPTVKRIGVIYDPSKTQDILNDAEEAAKKIGITLVKKQIRSTGEAINVIKQMEGNIDALWMVPDTTAVTPESIEYSLLFSFRNGIPVIGISDKYVKSGALFALTFDAEDMGRQAGEVTMRILQGEGIKTISFLKPRRLKLSLNLNTAEKMGIKIPERIVRNADVVYK